MTFHEGISGIEIWMAMGQSSKELFQLITAQHFEVIANELLLLEATVC